MRRFLLGLVFTAASIALLARVVDWDLTRAALQRADPLLIALAVTCLVVSLIAKTARWRLLLPAEAPVSTPRLYRILHISFLLNNVLPVRMGDVARVALTARQPGIRLGHVISSLLTERVTDAITLLACFVVISPFLPVPAAYSGWLHAAWVILGGLGAAALATMVLRRRLRRVAAAVGGRLELPATGRFRDELSSFGDGMRQLFSRRHVLRIWGWSGAAWAGAFAINWLLMRAIGIETPIAAAVLLTCTTNLAMLLPSSPGYVGVFHAAATLSLVPFDVGASQALSFAILAHLVNVLPVSIIGAVFLLAGRESLLFAPVARQIARRRPGKP